MSINRAIKRQHSKKLQNMDTTAKKDMAQAMLKQVELKAKASGKAEAVNYYRDRLMNEVPKIKGIGPVLFQEISKALGFQEDNQN